MFFVLSKLLYFLIQPINWLFFLLGWAVITRRGRRRRRLLLSALGLFYLLSNSFLFNLVVRWWEPETLTADAIHTPYDVGILLGGYSNFEAVPRADRHNFSVHANRFLNAYELYRTGKVKKLLLTGGSGRLFNRTNNEALSMKAFLTRIGVPEEDLLIEPDARNTYENALFSQRLLAREMPGARCLLLTSAWHMPRAYGCFRKVGLECTPFAIDYMSEEIRWTPGKLLLPDRLGLFRWELLIKEWVGCVAYRLRGYL
ncbi:MAG: YdcF family protein [Bacteroidetes bacterium]|nr:MAG: YdcF family protein [Bacteroidota bacterium]